MPENYATYITAQLRMAAHYENLLDKGNMQLHHPENKSNFAYNWAKMEQHWHLALNAATL